MERGRPRRPRCAAPAAEAPLTRIHAGHESGGHGYGAAPPLFSLVSDILPVLPEDGPPLLAAGGVVNGRQIASLLVLGVAGVVLGTRFLMTTESLYSDAQKQALVAAKSDMTVRTMAFDRARGTLQWPTGVDGRGLYNSTVRDAESGEVDMVVVHEKFRQGVRSSDPDRMLVWSGMGVGLISEIKGARVSFLTVPTVHRLIVCRRSSRSFTTTFYSGSSLVQSSRDNR